MTKRPKIGHDGTSGQEMANDKVCQRLQGGQGQVGVPQESDSRDDEVNQPHQGVQSHVGVSQVPLLGHGSEI